MKITKEVISRFIQDSMGVKRLPVAKWPNLPEIVFTTLRNRNHHYPYVRPQELVKMRDRVMAKMPKNVEELKEEKLLDLLQDAIFEEEFSVMEDHCDGSV